MKHLKFEWDSRKAETNAKKHGVTFEEAKSIFYDENAVEFYDTTHSILEDRFLLLGYSNHARMLLVCHCYREDDETIRIISARKATAKESQFYKGR